MFQENLKALRRKKGMSQEELAARLHVVRQTVSKWEKGLSVPDSDLLIRLAEVFEVSVGELLGERIEAEEKPNALAEQLSRINEQLAIRNRRAARIWKTIAWIVGGLFVLSLLLVLLLSVNSNEPLSVDRTTSRQILEPIGGEK
ncbi:MAG: helix-turn-helix transcriptional regulator [Clostridia bacterium]|nr:helix-turn-helix transcriptional regulator [Clostridia bacterium]